MPGVGSRALRVLPRVCVAVLVGFAYLRGTAEVVVENDSLRLVLADAGYATSLVCKETGEECLAQGVKMPFCTLTQYRPYDNENFLIHPAKPTTYPANRIARDGDRLVVEFDGTADVPEADLVTRFKAALDRLGICFTTKGSQK